MKTFWRSLINDSNKYLKNYLVNPFPYGFFDFLFLYQSYGFFNPLTSWVPTVKRTFSAFSVRQS